MDNTFSLHNLSQLHGYIASALVDCESGVATLKHGEGFDLDFAAAGNAEVIKAKRKVTSGLQLNDDIEDFLISLHKQYHLLRPLETNRTLFLYLVLDRAKANLALARHSLKLLDESFDYS